MWQTERLSVGSHTSLPRAGAFLAIVASCVACSGSPDPAPVNAVPHYDENTLAMKRQVVLTLIQDLSCTEDSDCSSFAFGSKPCGGPWEYVVFSTATVDGQRLSEAVADHTAYQAGWNAQEGVLSDCALAPQARPACVEDKCVNQP